MVNYTELTQIIREEFADIVIDIYRIDAKLRVLLCDESYLNFWWSEVQEGRFAHHWNRQNVEAQFTDTITLLIGDGLRFQPFLSTVIKGRKRQ